MTVNPHAQPLSVAARPELTGGRRIGVLLSHGFTGSPASMRPWGESLAERGYGVEVPRLPGHGTSWQEMNATGWADWYGHLDRTLTTLAAECDTVVLAGLSMGGGLVLSLAAHHPDLVSGVVLVNPAVTSANKQLLAVPVLRRLTPSIAAISGDIKKQGVTEYAYDRTPLHALASMMKGWKQVRGELERVTAPVLLFRSETDHVVDPTSGAYLQAHVAGEVTERLLTNSFHVATLDHDAPAIFEESAAFVARVTA